MVTNNELDKLRAAFDVEAPNYKINIERSPRNPDAYKYEFAENMWELVQAIVRRSTSGSDLVKCETCNGKGGAITSTRMDPESGPEHTVEYCTDCGGIGRVEAQQASGSDGTAAADVLNQIADLFGIGSAARTPSTILENVRNTIRRADCLSAVERQFFMVECEPDEEDDEPGETCLLNWGDGPEQYAQQFGEVLPLVARAALAQQAGAPTSILQARATWPEGEAWEDVDQVTYTRLKSDGRYETRIVYAAPAPVAEEVPRSSIDTPEFRDLLNWHHDLNNFAPDETAARIIAHVDAAMSASQGKTEEAK